MSIVQKLFELALEPVLKAAAGPAAEVASRFIEERFTDRSQRLNTALRKAHARTWQTLEMALAGDSLWQRLKGVLARGDEQAFRQQLQGLLELAPLPDL